MGRRNSRAIHVLCCDRSNRNFLLLARALHLPGWLARLSVSAPIPLKVFGIVAASGQTLKQAVADSGRTHIGRHPKMLRFTILKQLCKAARGGIPRLGRFSLLVNGCLGDLCKSLVGRLFLFECFLQKSDGVAETELFGPCYERAVARDFVVLDRLGSGE